MGSWWAGSLSTEPRGAHGGKQRRRAALQTCKDAMDTPWRQEGGGRSIPRSREKP